MKNKNAVRKLLSVVLVLALCIGLSVSAFADTPVRVGNDEAGNESILISNIVSTEQLHVRIEGFPANVTVVHATAPATVTIARDISVFDMWEGRFAGNGFPITQLHLPTNTDIMDYFAYFETNPSGMDITRTQLTLTTGELIPNPNAEFYYTVPASSTIALLEGVYRVSVEGSFGTPLLYIVVDGNNEPPAPTPTPQSTNPDLSSASTWARTGISNAIESGLVPQSLQNNFTNNTTRAEFAALAVSIYETITGTEITGRMQFNDTNDINVQKMGYLGVVTGVGSGNFAPNNTLTREQAAVMLARLAEIIGQPLPHSSPTFADNVRISSWAVDAVGQIQAAGIMGGTGNNNFSPRSNYTREQSIITMLRLFVMLS
ncbi:MAG: S-layer homology domain-containing protein [Defluviitaleaceae bacterium]|nr:S-layer homology domain-containing protein [Defluviitaleaceae bacterium]